MEKKMLVLLMLLLMKWPAFCQQSNSPGDRPNILFIAIDDLNTWLGCMQGHPNALTPNIDRLASKGALFTNAHCQAPLCGPSRASVMTGLRPSSTGIYGMIDDDNIKKDNRNTENVVLLPEYFKQNGYQTMGIGKLFHQHVPDGLLDESGGRVPGFGPRPEKRFVWEGNGPDGYGRTSTDWGAFPVLDEEMPDDQSTDWAIERLSRSYDKPFFLAVGFLRPHVPWYVPSKWFDHFDVDEITLPQYKLDDLNDVPATALKINDLPMMPSTKWAVETGEYKNMVQAYLACILFVDFQVGRLLDALDSSRYADNTIIVLWSDHGYRVGEKGTFAKHALWEEATRVPMIISSPRIEERKIIEEPVELLSLYPTLIEMCNLPPNIQNEGLSLVPLLKERSEESQNEYYAITTYGMNNHSIRSRNYRYILYEDGGEELYDHRIDPYEWRNVADDVFYAPIKKILQDKLPEKNVPWAIHSQYTFQPYFMKQKSESLEQK